VIRSEHKTWQEYVAYVRKIIQISTGKY